MFVASQLARFSGKWNVFFSSGRILGQVVWPCIALQDQITFVAHSTKSDQQNADYKHSLFLSNSNETEEHFRHQVINIS